MNSGPCLSCETLRALARDLFAAQAENVRPWPDLDLLIGDCPICGSMCSVPVEPVTP